MISKCSTSLFLILLLLTGCQGPKTISGHFSTGQGVYSFLTLHKDSTCTYSCWACSLANSFQTGKYHIKKDTLFLQLADEKPRYNYYEEDSITYVVENDLLVIKTIPVMKCVQTGARAFNCILFQQYGKIYSHKTKTNYTGEWDNTDTTNSSLTAIENIAARKLYLGENE